MLLILLQFPAPTIEAQCMDEQDKSIFIIFTNIITPSCQTHNSARRRKKTKKTMWILHFLSRWRGALCGWFLRFSFLLLKKCSDIVHSFNAQLFAGIKQWNCLFLWQILSFIRIHHLFFFAECLVPFEVSWLSMKFSLFSQPSNHCHRCVVKKSRHIIDNVVNLNALLDFYMNFLQHYSTVWSRCLHPPLQDFYCCHHSLDLSSTTTTDESETRHSRTSQDLLEKFSDENEEINFPWIYRFSFCIRRLLRRLLVAVRIYTVCASLAFPSSMLFLSVIFFRSLSGFDCCYWFQHFSLRFLSAVSWCCLWSAARFWLRVLYVWWIFNLIYIQLELHSGPNPSQWQPVNSICKYMPSSDV